MNKLKMNIYAIKPSFCYFVCMISVTLCSLFPCLVFVPGLHYFDYRYNLGSLDHSLHLYIDIKNTFIDLYMYVCIRQDFDFEITSTRFYGLPGFILSLPAIY